MSNIKVLPLPWWAKIDKQDILECTGKRIDPIFNRHGMYLDASLKRCWIETPFGCYEYNRAYKSMLHEIKFFDHRPLDCRERKALNILILGKRANNEMKELKRMDDHWYNIKEMHLKTRKVANEIKKSVKI
jgi:hypothetical protein